MAFLNSRVYVILITVICSTWFTRSYAQKNELDHQMAQDPQLSLVLATDDDERLLLDVLNWWGRQENAPMPTLITTEPGPVDMRGGLRVLANEIPPKLSLPDLLIISNLGQLRFTDAFLAFVRRCLIAEIPVWVVGSFPDDLLHLPLSPGEQISRIDAADFPIRLVSWCSGGENQPQP